MLPSLDAIYTGQAFLATELMEERRVAEGGMTRMSRLVYNFYLELLIPRLLHCSQQPWY